MTAEELESDMKTPAGRICIIVSEKERFWSTQEVLPGNGMMKMVTKDRKKEKAVKKALLEVERREKKLGQAAMKAKPAGWKTAFETQIPPKVHAGLESAFSKGFSLVFNQGRAVIERSYNKEDIKADHAIRHYAVQRKGGRKELRQVRKGAGKSNFLNLTVTTVEGIGLGTLGIGMPDIVLFLGILLKGIYETALNYGFDYDTRQEQLLILKMMETSLMSGDAWIQKNAEVDEMLGMETIDLTEDVFNKQIKDTSAMFAVDMLLLKFVQGIPIIGIVGGAANPLYYNKVMKYVELKYRKRYLRRQANSF